MDRQPAPGRAPAHACLLAALAVALTDARPLRADRLDERPLGQLQHRAWGVEEGLPQTSVTGIVQSRDGFLWAATHEGVVRFDGVAFDVWDELRHPAIANHDVLGIAEDRDGALWFATHGGGVVRKRGHDLARFGRDEGLPHEDVYTVVADPRGGVWVGTFGGGAARFDGRRFERAPGLPDPRVRALAVDADGTVWVGTDAGGLYASTGDATPAVHSWRVIADLHARRVLALLPSARGLWVGTDDGLARVARDGTVARVAAAAALGRVNALHEDADGTLWLGTSHGLLRLRDGLVERMPAGSPLATGAVDALRRDRRGNLWVGSADTGLHRLRAAPFVPYGAAEGIQGTAGALLYAAREGVLLAGGPDRLLRFENGRFVVDPRSRHLPPARVTALAETADDSLWVGFDGGLTRFGSDGQRESWRSGSDLPGIAVMAVAADAHGDVWLGTRWGGVVRLRRDADGKARFEALSPKQDGWVQTLLVDGDRLVAGVRGLQIYAADGTASRFGLADGFAEVPVTGLVRDGDGTVWASTNGAGIYRLQAGRLVAFGLREGLPGLHLLRLVDDGAGHLYASTNRGVLRVGRTSLDQNAAARHAGLPPAPLDARVFDESDGLPSRELGMATIARDAAGRLWFATIRGVAAVDPRDLPGDAPAPTPVVDEVRVDGIPLAPGAPVPAGSERLEIRWSAPTLEVPGRVRFRHRLSGVDSAWVEQRGRAAVVYTDPPAGRLRFELAASGEDGRFLDDAGSTAVEIVVTPTLFQRTDTRLALVALVGLLLATAHRGGTAILRRRQRELEATVAERTRELAAARERAEQASAAKTVFLASMSHELRTPLHAVLGYAELATRAPGAGTDREHVRRIAEAGEHLRALVEDVLSLSRIEAGEPPEVVLAPFSPRRVLAEVADMLDERAREKGLALRVEASDLPEAVDGDAGKLRQILLNLAANAVKFTVQGAVVLRAQRRDAGHLRFEVEDTGPGIAPADAERLFRPFSQADAGYRAGEGVGLGLAISRRLATLLGGSLELAAPTLADSDRAPRGARFVLDLPLCATATASHSAPEPGLGVRSAIARRALVVDDDPGARGLLVAQLQANGFAVDTAADGARVVERVVRDGPDLLCVDLHLRAVPGAATPVTNGAALVRAIRANAPADRPLAVLGITASALDQDRSELRDAGCDAVLGKPFGEADLAKALAAILPPPRRPTVLLADDHAPTRALTARALTALGCDVTTVAGGGAAVDRCRQGRFDLVLLDSRMPDLDGARAARAIVDELPAPDGGAGHRRPRIVLLSADDPDVTRRRLAGAAGVVDAVLAKPLDPHELAAWLGSGGGAPPATAVDAAPAGDGATTSDFDDGALASYAAIDPQLAASLAAGWIASSAQELAALRSALAATDETTIARLRHNLEGSALVVGAVEVAARCRALRLGGTDGDAGASLDDLVAAVERAHRRLAAFTQPASSTPGAAHSTTPPTTHAGAAV